MLDSPDEPSFFVPRPQFGLVFASMMHEVKLDKEVAGHTSVLVDGTFQSGS